MAENEFPIRELADRAGTTVRTIRYYAALGLLPDPISRGKYAYYTSAHLDRLKLIQKLKNLRYPLSEIQDTFQRHSDVEIRDMLEKAARPPAGKNALEYIARLTNYWEEAKPPEIQQSSAPHQPSFFLKEQTSGEETWRRIPLAYGVELHIREPNDQATAHQISQLIAFAHQLFQKHH